MKLPNETKTIFKSWAKTFVAACIAGYMAGLREPKDLLTAGVCAILPVLYAWFDPKDLRYGKSA